MSPDLIAIEVARMLHFATAWERRLRHFDVLCDAGVDPDRALEIVTQAEADRQAENMEIAA